MIKAWFDQARQAVAQADFPAAARRLEELLAQTPDHVEAWRLLARVRDSLAQPAEAAAARREAQQREAENLAVAARGLWLAGMVAPARAGCRKALALSPGNPTALLLASQLARQVGDFAAAAADLARLTDLAEQRPSALPPDLAAQATFDGAVVGAGLTAAGNPCCPAGQSWATPFLRRENWLPRARHDRLLSDLAARWNPQHQDPWQAATVWTRGKYQQSADHRVASVLYNPPEVRRWFLPRLEAILPQAFACLGLAPFQPGQIELQVSAYRRHEYYRAHRDTAWPEAAESSSDGRVLTFVYYFSRRPQRFRGGALKLHDTNCASGQVGAGFSLIAPEANSLLCFPSVALHEVCPLELDSDDPLDGRFTVNGWIHR